MKSNIFLKFFSKNEIRKHHFNIKDRILLFCADLQLFILDGNFINFKFLVLKFDCKIVF